MKFSTSSTELLKHLQIAGGAITNNPVLPILEDFLFTIKDNHLKITASDLDTTIITTIDIMAEKDGSIAIPAKILTETLKALPEQPITFEVDESSYNVTLTSAFGTYKLSGENGADFPETPTSSNVDEIEIPTDILSHAIINTIFATSSDDLRPTMTGVYFLFEDNKATFVATDAHKLVKYSHNITNESVSASFIMPKKALNLLKSSLASSPDVRISFNKSNAFFTFGNFQMACRLIEGRYPDYNMVIPVDNPNIMTIRRLDFLNSLKRIAIYANKTTNQVLIKIDGENLNISSQDLDFSNEAEETIPCTYDGKQMQIAFNAKFLIEMLSILSSGDITLELSEPNRAGILRPADQDPSSDLLMLVMPVMINVQQA
ncbi:MAG: DNA polymerase III subunit beta [Saprospiraceae bacterium]|nr:DNA polymerase III subunit beta [Saprospiraceae bacterium]